VVSRELRGGQGVYVKRYFDGVWYQSADTIRARTAREADVIGRLADLDGIGGRLGVLSVLDCRPELAELVTAEVPGRVLQDVLANSASHHQQRSLVRAIYLAGKWLRVYQTMSIDTDDRVTIGGDPENLGDYCLIRFNKLRDLGYHWPDTMMQARLFDNLKHLAAAAPADEEDRVWCHADYAPNNILWDGRVLTPIDFGMACIERPLLDVTYFIHRLEMQRVYRPWKRWPIASCRRAFLRGYGRPDAEQSPMYRALMIRHWVCRLLTYVRRPPRNLKQRVHNAYLRTCVRRRMIDAVSATIESPVSSVAG
jgi:tRNA A-37 threonylcarbamoyl transferase component Bud32